MSLQTLIDATAKFYEWELRGRGWRSYETPVSLEPVFVPFRRSTDLDLGIIDDARRPSLVSSFFDRLAGRKGAIDPIAIAFEEPSNRLPLEPAPRAEFELLIPITAKVPTGTTEAIIRACASCLGPVAYELVGASQRVSLRISSEVRDSSVLLSQLRAFLPGATVHQAECDLPELYENAEGTAFGALEFGLAREFLLPLRALSQTPDPILSLLGAVAGVKAGNRAVLQVVFTSAKSAWREGALRAVRARDGEPFFLDDPGFTDLAEAKCQEPLYAVAIRALAVGSSAEEVGELISRMAGALGQYADPESNALVPLATDRGQGLVEDILTRSTYRSGMLLSLSELASLVRFPGESVRHDALIRSVDPGVTLSKEVLGEGVILGDSEHRRELIPVRLGVEARLQHTHVLGGSGTGKSTLLVSMILEDILAGHGVGVVDPHGDLVDEVLGRIPANRQEDVVLLDPSDPTWIVGWNILGAHSDVEKELLSSDLVAVFKRLSTSWGDQMSAVLGNAVHAFLESSKGGTLIDLRKFLLDDTFRMAFLGTVEDDHVRSFWEEEFPLLASKKPQAPILTRLDTFLRSRLVRTTVTEREKPLDFRRMMDDGKIFLAKLSQGAIGQENAALLGSLIVSKFHQTALTRQDTSRESRRPFFLFLDEFHEFATPSMAGLFSGVRKYNVGLCVAHQDLYQLHGSAPEVERAVLTNAYSRIIFRTADEDARKLEGGFGAFTRADFTGLNRGQAIARVGRRENAFRLNTRALPEIDPAVADETRLLIREASMGRSGRQRVSVVRSDRPSDRPGTRSRARSAIPVPTAPAAREEVAPGRGGAMHKYLQSFIREAAYARGFRAEIEKELPGGQRIDVLLTALDVTIACEVGGITTLEQELANLRKCVEAGMTHVCAVSLDLVLLRRIAEEVERWADADRNRVQTLSPEEFTPWLSGILVQPEEKRVAGYSVRVTHSGNDASARERKRAIADVMMKSVRKLKE